MAKLSITVGKSKKNAFIQRISRFATPLLLLFIGLSFNIQASELQDPTKPVKYQAPQKAKRQSQVLPKLQAIFTNGNTRSALLNQEKKQQGQTIAGFKLIKIGTDYVLIMRNNQQHRLNLFPSIVINKK